MVSGIETVEENLSGQTNNVDGGTLTVTGLSSQEYTEQVTTLRSGVLLRSVYHSRVTYEPVSDPIFIRIKSERCFRTFPVSVCERRK